MIWVYRKRKDGSRWHFHTQCSNWPEDNYVQLQIGQLADDEPLCEECIRREEQMFPKRKSN